jgi:hypothetical protein
MKSDCQRFRVAGQRTFGGVWDEFSRGFPQAKTLAANCANEHESKLFLLNSRAFALIRG